MQLKQAADLGEESASHLLQAIRKCSQESLEHNLMPGMYDLSLTSESDDPDLHTLMQWISAIRGMCHWQKMPIFCWLILVSCTETPLGPLAST
jgi:hypothetical protein